MIPKRVKSLKDRLPSKTRALILLLVSSTVLTYIVYESASRTSRFSKLTTPGDWRGIYNKSGILTGGKVFANRKFTVHPNFKHVDRKESSYFKTTARASLTSAEDERLASRFRERRTRVGEKAESGLVRGQENSHDLIAGVDKQGNNSILFPFKDRDHRKPSMRFANQDERDNDEDSEDKAERKRLPNALIIGAKKGGTRAILEILKIHPNVRACSSEVHFFDRDENYNQGLEWYRQQMPVSLPGQITIEKSPSYFVTPKVPERVYRMSKYVKLIVIVRDPTRRAVSDYTQSLERKPDNPPFEEIVIDEDGEINESWSKITIGRYADHLSQWLKFFPLSQFHFVSGEELIERPAREIQLVEKFLNLRPHIKEENFYFNDSKGFPCFIGKISNSGSVSKTHCLRETKGRKHPAVKEEVLKRLHDYFRPLNKKFYEMAGRNFHWP